jgi:hypothetical protein
MNSRTDQNIGPGQSKHSLMLKLLYTQQKEKSEKATLVVQSCQV